MSHSNPRGLKHLKVVARYLNFISGAIAHSSDVPAKVVRKRLGSTIVHACKESIRRRCLWCRSARGSNTSQCQNHIYQTVQLPDKSTRMHIQSLNTNGHRCRLFLMSMRSVILFLIRFSEAPTSLRQAVKRTVYPHINRVAKQTDNQAARMSGAIDKTHVGKTE